MNPKTLIRERLLSRSAAGRKPQGHGEAGKNAFNDVFFKCASSVRNATGERVLVEGVLWLSFFESTLAPAPLAPTRNRAGEDATRTQASYLDFLMRPTFCSASNTNRRK